MKHIHILSPASAIDAQWINQAKTRLELWGFRVSLAEHVYGNNGRFAAIDDDRLADLNEAFADTTVDIILCSRGGYGLQRILDRIELPQRPKEQWPLVVGFSDITALHSLMSLNGVASLHGNMCKDISLLPDDDLALVAEKKILLGEPIDALSVVPSPLNRQGKVFGTLIGGNLSLLYGLQGTPYDLHHIIDQCITPPILFVEEIGEKHYHVDRMMHNLRMSGVFERIGGLVVGQFTDCDDDSSMGCSVFESIRNVVAEYDFPVLFNCPSGHIDSNYPLKMMNHYSLVVNQNKCTLTLQE